MKKSHILAGKDKCVDVVENILVAQRLAILVAGVQHNLQKVAVHRRVADKVEANKILLLFCEPRR